MKQFPSHAITANNTPPSFQALVDLFISSPGSDNLSLLFTQFHSLINTKLCSSLIQSFTHSRNHLHSLLLYSHMRKLSLPLDTFTFSPLLKSIAHLRLPILGASIHCDSVKMGLWSHVFTATALVHMYCAFTRIGDARKLFDEMPGKNSVSWNVMITGYVHNRRFTEAHRLFSEMQASDAELGEVTVVGALSACAHLGSLNQGIWIHNYIKERGLKVNVFVGTALTDMYMKCGVVDEATKVFRAMTITNVFSWNAFISGLAMNGRGEDAMAAFDTMIAKKIKPDGVTFLAALCACCHQGFVDEGRRLFERMRMEIGLHPRIEHYGCMVDLLSRAGLLDEAHELIRSMPMDADVVVWRALLAGCRIHGNVSMGEIAVRKLLELEPGNGDNFVLLSNLLARDQRWTVVGKVWETMSRRGIQKVPGCSSIEIDNVVHEFVATNRFDRTGLDEIYKMAADMNRELKLAGYVPDIHMVSL